MPRISLAVLLKCYKEQLFILSVVTFLYVCKIELCSIVYYVKKNGYRVYKKMGNYFKKNSFETMTILNWSEFRPLSLLVLSTKSDKTFSNFKNKVVGVIRKL